MVVVGPVETQQGLGLLDNADQHQQPRAVGKGLCPLHAVKEFRPEVAADAGVNGQPLPGGFVLGLGRVADDPVDHQSVKMAAVFITGRRDQAGVHQVFEYLVAG